MAVRFGLILGFIFSLLPWVGLLFGREGTQGAFEEASRNAFILFVCVLAEATIVGLILGGGAAASTR